jgi:hypothetical protein
LQAPTLMSDISRMGITRNKLYEEVRAGYALTGFLHMP